jgi:predicted MFS family arabinose efflux permease
LGFFPNSYHIALMRPLIIFARVVVPFGIGYYISYLYRTVNVVISGQMASELALSAADLGLLTGLYFIIFAAFQTPLGILLDRYGPRRTQAILLIFAAIGSGIFAVSDEFGLLALGRGLIGLGVSGCLMAALKANATWFASDRLPLINGITVAFGSFGALTATVPVELVFEALGWRSIFSILAVFTSCLIIGTWLAVPEGKKTFSGPGPTLDEQFRELAFVYKNGFFWRVSVVTFVHNAAFLSYQSLWMGPWLRDMAGFDASNVAFTMLLFNGGMFLGVLGIGALAERLQLVGIKPIVVVAAGILGSISVQLFFVFDVSSNHKLLCFLFGFFGSSTLLVYSVLTQNFPKSLTGRVNTAQNMLTFIGAFVAQWGIGLIINQWPASSNGNFDPAGHQSAFAFMVILQILAFLFFAWPRNKNPDNES